MALAFDPYQYGTAILHNLGYIHRYNGNDYMYVYIASTSVAAKGAPAYPQPTRGYMKKDTNKTGGAYAAGAWTAAVPTVNYGWLLVRGWADYLLGDSGTAAGEAVYAGGDIWATATIGTHHVQGQADTDDTASIFTGRLWCS